MSVQNQVSGMSLRHDDAEADAQVLSIHILITPDGVMAQAENMAT